MSGHETRHDGCLLVHQTLQTPRYAPRTTIIHMLATLQPAGMKSDPSVRLLRPWGGSDQKVDIGVRPVSPKDQRAATDDERIPSLRSSTPPHVVPPFFYMFVPHKARLIHIRFAWTVPQ
jgi:hypothetical protein